VANIKISALPAGAALAGTEQIPAVQSAATVKVLVSDIFTYVVGVGTIPNAQTFSGPITFNGVATFNHASNAVNGSISFNDDTTFAATMFYGSPITPSALASGNTDNYNPSGAIGGKNVFRLTPDITLGSTLTGIAAAAANYVMRLFNIQTGATGTLTLAHQDAGSSAGNRFICPGEVSLVIQAGGSVELWYDGASSRWRVLQ
jgi:hypothetical protein